jgi:hypothetical protein
MKTERINIRNPERTKKIWPCNGDNNNCFQQKQHIFNSSSQSKTSTRTHINRQQLIARRRVLVSQSRWWFWLLGEVVWAQLRWEEEWPLWEETLEQAWTQQRPENSRSRRLEPDHWCSPIGATASKAQMPWAATTAKVWLCAPQEPPPPAWTQSQHLRPHNENPTPQHLRQQKLSHRQQPHRHHHQHHFPIYQVSFPALLLQKPPKQPLFPLSNKNLNNPDIIIPCVASLPLSPQVLPATLVLEPRALSNQPVANESISQHLAPLRHSLLLLHPAPPTW